jgi:hypothetical protein
LSRRFTVSARTSAIAGFLYLAIGIIVPVDYGSFLILTREVIALLAVAPLCGWIAPRFTAAPNRRSTGSSVRISGWLGLLLFFVVAALCSKLGMRDLVAPASALLPLGVFAGVWRAFAQIPEQLAQ